MGRINPGDEKCDAHRGRRRGPQGRISLQRILPADTVELDPNWIVSDGDHMAHAERAELLT